MTEPPRRLPAPWRVVEFPDSYCVEDANGQRLGARGEPRHRVGTAPTGPA